MKPLDCTRTNQKIATFVCKMPTVLDLRQLTQQRLDEADDLLGIGRVDAAFYLAGYARCAGPNRNGPESGYLQNP